MLLPLRSDPQRFEEIHLITQTSVLPPSLPKAAAASTPLALLLATANKPAAPPLPLLPLAPSKPTGLRIKRKPQISKFRPKDRKRFRPRARVTESSVNEVHDDKEEEEDHDAEAKIDSKEKLHTREPASKLNKKSKKVHNSRFSAFGRRPKPGVVGSDRRREDLGAKSEEEKLEDRETTIPQRQPTTLQASLE